MRLTPYAAYDRLVTGDGPFAIVECPACCFGLTEPQLTNEELAPFYAAAYYEGYYEHSGAGRAGLLHRLRARHRKRSAARRNRRPPFGLPGVRAGKVLDVGCGAGGLLADFAQRGWSTFGIDPSAAATAAAERRGAQVHQGTLEDDPWPGESFELITMAHALEHIVDPVATVERAGCRLAPGGLLAIEVPNWACWQRRLYRRRWAPLDLPRHQQHFSPSALARIASRFDLGVREVGTSSTPISTAYSIHFLIAGRWTPGWKLWLSYGISLPLLPFVYLVDHFAGGDCCYAVLEKPR